MTNDACTSTGALRGVSGVALPTSASGEILSALVSVPCVTNWVTG